MIILKKLTLTVTLVLLCIVTPPSCVVFQNFTYADTIFANRVNYNQVLASRQWTWGKTFDCSYAVVSLTEEAPNFPPVTWLEEASLRKTPVLLANPAHLSYGENPISVCVAEGEFSSGVAARLEAGVKDPGSYYTHLGENLSLYSKPQRIAAIVRYGD